MPGDRDQLPLFPSAVHGDADRPGVPQPDALDRLRAAAGAYGRAGQKLESAIFAARRAGHSWRAIGEAAELPFQTLARRYGEGVTFNPTGGPGSDVA